MTLNNILLILILIFLLHIFLFLILKKFKSRVPWWSKIVLKLYISLFPINHKFWKKIGVFENSVGISNNAEIAVSTFLQYYNIISKHTVLPEQFNCMEIGPGDTILTSLVAKKYGAKTYWTIDNGSFADLNIHAFKETAKYLKLGDKDFASFNTIEDLLLKNNIMYKTNGVISMKEIPSSSLSYIWSRSVLEHVYLDEFDSLVKELHRTLKSGALGIHSIDFRDHLGGVLSNLRFEEKTWESNRFRNSGFYTNRIRPSAMIEIFHENGFETNILHKDVLNNFPIERDKISKKFSTCSDEDLLTTGYLLLTKCKK